MTSPSRVCGPIRRMRRNPLRFRDRCRVRPRHAIHRNRHAPRSRLVLTRTSNQSSPHRTTTIGHQERGTIGTGAPRTRACTGASQAGPKPAQTGDKTGNSGTPPDPQPICPPTPSRQLGVGSSSPRCVISPRLKQRAHCRRYARKSGRQRGRPMPCPNRHSGRRSRVPRRHVRLCADSQTTRYRCGRSSHRRPAPPSSSAARRAGRRSIMETATRNAPDRTAATTRPHAVGWAWARLAARLRPTPNGPLAADSRLAGRFCSVPWRVTL